MVFYKEWNLKMIYVQCRIETVHVTHGDMHAHQGKKSLSVYKLTLTLVCNWVIKQLEIWTLVPTAKKKLLALERMFNVAVPRGYNRPTVRRKSLLKPRLAS